MTQRNDYWKRTVEEEVRLRASMVRGTFLEAAAQAVIDQIGSTRAGRQVPISGATNLVRRHLAVTAVAHDYCAMFGADPAFLALCSDSSAKTWTQRLTKIGAAPIPSGLVDGGESGGLRRLEEYLQALGYCGAAVEWSERSERPYLVVCRPDDLLPGDIRYAPDDPLSPVRVRWRRMRVVDTMEREVHDVWDITDPDAPTFHVEIGNEDVTKRCPALAEALASGMLSGPGYWWRYTMQPSANRPFIPVIVFGSPAWVMAGVHITEAALDAAVFRTATKSAMIDAGFTTREVEGLVTGADSDGTTGQQGGTQGHGDVRVWRRREESSPGQHWEFGASVDPEKLYRVTQAQEVDAENMLGVPLDLTRLGGEPFAHAVALQGREAAKWHNILRSGTAILMRRLAAITNRRTGATFAEAGYSTLYQDELREALAAAERPAEPKPEPDTDTTETPADGGEE